MKQKVFGGLEVRDSPLTIEDIHSPDCQNVRVENPIGTISNSIGTEKYGNVGALASIVAIHQLEDEFFLLGDYELGTLPGRVWLAPSEPWWTFLEKPNEVLYRVDYDPVDDVVYIAGDEYIIKASMDGVTWETYGYLLYGDPPGPAGGVDALRGIHYDSSGFIYATDIGGDDPGIIKTKFDGTGWTRYGTEGSGVGEFDNPYGIDYDSVADFIYVADANNNRIVKTKIDGTGWTTLGGFSEPFGVHYDAANGLIYVADKGNSRIVRSEIDGSNWATFGSSGTPTTAGKFQNPNDIFLTDDDWIYISDGQYIIKTKWNDTTDWTVTQRPYSSVWGLAHDNTEKELYFTELTLGNILQTNVL